MCVCVCSQYKLITHFLPFGSGQSYLAVTAVGFCDWRKKFYDRITLASTVTICDSVYEVKMFLRNVWTFIQPLHGAETQHKTTFWSAGHG
jgi:hypothetical protein